MRVTQQIKLYDFEPDTSNLYAEVIAGLQKPTKELPSILLYDERGSQLFDQICETEEYYPTQTELSIMQDNINEMASLIGENALLIEYGSGSSLKTQFLLDHLPHLAGYIPIDISKEFLIHVATKIAKRYPHIEVLPVCADYNQSFHLPSPTKPAMHRVAYHPSSNISHLHPHEAVAFLKRVREVCGPKGGLLIGVDLKKDPEILNRAYNTGRSTAFILNTLSHTNRRFSANFDPSYFEHQAFYNEKLGRVEVYLVSQRKHTAYLNGDLVSFKAGERIHIAYSYKYGLDEFSTLATQGGWQVKQVWTDDNQLFSIQYLTSK